MSRHSSDASARTALRIAVALLLGALALAYGRTLLWQPGQEVPGAVSDALEGWFFSTVGSAPALTLALGAWLVWNRRGTLLARAPTAADAALAGALGLAAAVLLLWSHAVGAPELGVPSLALGVLAGSLAVGGRGAGRAAVVPALFMLLAHPIPVAWVNALLYPMQIFTAAATSTILSALGVAHVHSGDLIETSTRHFRVIETCSGLRASVTLTMGALLYLELFHRSRRQAVAILASVLPLAQALNLVRVTSIVLIPQSSIDSIHTVQGMAMLFVGVFALAGIDALEARLAGTRRRRARHPRPGPPARGAARRLGWVAAGVATVGALSFAVPRFERPARSAPRLFTLPAELDGHRTDRLPLDREFLGALRPSDSLSRHYGRNGRGFDVLILADEHRDRFDSILSPKAGVIGSGWAVLESAPRRIDGIDWPVVESLQGRYEERALALQITTGVASGPEEWLRSALVLDRGPWRRSRPALSVLVSTPVPNAPDGRAAATARLHDFARTLVAALERARILDRSDPPQR